MPKYFRRNFTKYRIRERSAPAKVLNHYMSHAHTVHPSGHFKEYHWNALNPIRALSLDDSVSTLLLAYEQFLWLFEDSNVKQRHGDSVTYASGLDFAIQILARKQGLRFSNDQVARLVRAYLTHPHPTPCLPPQIIVGLISKQAGKLARARELGSETARLLRRVAKVLSSWNREDWGAMPKALLVRIEKALAAEKE